MPRGACTFRRIAAALKAAKQADMPVRRWRITKDGELIFETGEPNEAEPDNGTAPNVEGELDIEL